METESTTMLCWESRKSNWLYIDTQNDDSQSYKYIYLGGGIVDFEDKFKWPKGTWKDT